MAITVCVVRSTVPCRSAGRTLIAEAAAAGENNSVMVTTVPTGSKPFWTQYPAGITKLAPPAVNENLVPGVTPAPAILQTFSRPSPPAVFVKSTSVWPVPIFTVTRPADRSTGPWRSGGSTVIADTVVPVEGVSLTTTELPTGNVAADTQDPAATVIGVPPALNEKLIPGATPAPLSLQISRVPRRVSETTVFRNVAIVCPPALTVTVAVPAVRLLATSNPAGKVITELKPVPGDGDSVIKTAPAEMTKGALHEPPGAGPAKTVIGFPATLKVTGVPTATPAPATLQICRKPVP